MSKQKFYLYCKIKAGEDTDIIQNNRPNINGEKTQKDLKSVRVYDAASNH